MKPLLTTITPYWGRHEQLARWVKAVLGATIPEVQHFLYWIKGDVPRARLGLSIQFISTDSPSSIGHIHNIGAENCGTEWMMKLDVDCIPNAEFFKALLPVLQSARQARWFNAGMFMVDAQLSRQFLSQDALPLTFGLYEHLMRALQSKCGREAVRPVSTQFICRTEEYLMLGGCLPAFKGWGWEDYQQIYMLERHWLGRDPFEGQSVHINNVTRLCRDQISRPKAAELFQRNPYLALMHHYHEPAERNQRAMDRNKVLLYDYIAKRRK